MTFCGGKIAEGGFETEGIGRGVDMLGRLGSLLPFNDFLRDFMGVVERATNQAKPWTDPPVIGRNGITINHVTAQLMPIKHETVVLGDVVNDK